MATFIVVPILIWANIQVGGSMLSVSSELNETLTQMPNCNSTNPADCSINYAELSSNLRSLRSGFWLLNIFIVALLIVNVYIFLRLIRGGG